MDLSEYLNQPCDKQPCDRVATHNQGGVQVCNAHLDNSQSAPSPRAMDD